MWIYLILLAFAGVLWYDMNYKRDFGSDFMEFKLNDYHQNITDEQLLKDILRVANSLGKTTISKTEYVKNRGKYHSSTIEKRFDGWLKALGKCGLSPNKSQMHSVSAYNALISTQELINDLLRVSKKINKKTFSTGEYDQNGEKVDDPDDIQLPVETTTKSVNNELVHKTKRDINLRLRFTVMKRDNFKCCMCGRSPATTLGLELHIDHIIPWSKGGETSIDNLHTLCSDCNLGKSNLSEND